MHPVLLTVLVMLAFAANSVLNCAGLAETAISPLGFAAIRLAAGALTLGAIVAIRRRSRPGVEWRPAICLGLYAIGFSCAYLGLDAGAGTLILFGAVQVTMFAAALRGGERIPLRRWAGTGLAAAGLAWMLWPEGAEVAPWHSAAMLVAGIAWGLLSVIGRGSTDPLGQMAAAFLLAAPAGLVAWALIGAAVPGAAGAGPPDAEGAALAVLSGAVTSGLGYALWFRVLPLLSASGAALAQLSVPVIAIGLGALLLGEAVTPRIVLSAALVLGGVGVGLSPGGRRG